VSTTRIGPKHQITIPKDVFDALHLDVGDILEAEVESGKSFWRQNNLPKRLRFRS
jgi:AbrB family looped-hinge helix DNA binding protein